MARILVVEDEPAIAEALRQGLADERHVVDVTHDGAEGLWAAQGGAYDAIVLDRMLPGVDGAEICRRLRAGGDDTPILMLTARDALEDIVGGLDSGAQDYLTKPFRFEELLARLRALLRTRTRALANVIEVGDLRIDTVAHRATRGGDELSLTAQESRLLECLALRAGQIVSRARLTDALWGHDADPESNVLEVLVSSLRRKMDGGRGPRLIHTVRGAGYVLREETP